MDGSAPTPYVVEDCRGVVQLFSDGSIVRNTSAVPFPPAGDHDDGSVEWTDFIFDSGNNLGLRLYRPRDRHSGEKLPIIVYFHGGGFCIGSYAWPNTHAGCRRLSGELPAVLVSADYRLAPEHRYPAFYEDAEKALLWLRDCSDGAAKTWFLESGADFQRVFVAGESAGGNIAHHMAVRFGTAGLEPAVRISGYILLSPAFLAAEPSQSELDTPETAVLSRDAADRYSRLTLPAGATNDHPMMNPFGPDSPPLDGVDVGAMLVVIAENDMLRDREREYAQKMKEMGKNVQPMEIAGVEHAFFARTPWSPPADEMLAGIKDFVDKTLKGNIQISA